MDRLLDLLIVLLRLALEVAGACAINIIRIFQSLQNMVRRTINCSPILIYDSPLRSPWIRLASMHGSIISTTRTVIMAMRRLEARQVHLYWHISKAIRLGRAEELWWVESKRLFDSTHHSSLTRPTHHSTIRACALKNWNYIGPSSSSLVSLIKKAKRKNIIFKIYKFLEQDDARQRK